MNTRVVNITRSRPVRGQAVCRCGEPAEWYMDPDGDPLPSAMCTNCFVVWVAEEWEPEEEDE